MPAFNEGTLVTLISTEIRHLLPGISASTAAMVGAAAAFFLRHAHDVALTINGR